MKCNNCSCDIEITESNFCISDFNIIITCDNCLNDILEGSYDYEELCKVYWEAE